LALVVVTAVALGACGDDDSADSADDDGADAPAADDGATADAPADAAGESLAIGMALPTAANDGGFSQAYYEGLLAAEQTYGATVGYQENAGDPEQTVDALRNLASSSDLVIGVGAQFAEAGTIVAPEFPDVEFAVVNGQTSDAANLHAFIIRQGVPAYVAGVLAADLTQSGKLGFIGGLEIPPTTQSDDAFSAGAHSVNPDIETVSTVVGDFEDIPGAKEAASAQIAAGADVLFAFVNSGLEGVIQAVEESGSDVKVFSVIFPQCDRSPQLVGTATLSSLAQVDAIVGAYADGSLPDDLVLWGVENPDIQSFVLCPDHASGDFAATVADTLAGINAGDISLPEGV
jgi:basic membrane protein A